MRWGWLTPCLQQSIRSGKAERGVGAVETQVGEEGTVTGRFREALEKETRGCVKGEDICPGRSRGAGPPGGGHILSRHP